MLHRTSTATRVWLGPLLWALSLPVFADESPGDVAQISVMTFNIRTALGRDGDHVWPNRKALVAETILKYAPAVVGLQEALDEQIEYLDRSLTEYRWLGIDRGLNGGTGLSEATPLFYRYRELSPIESGNFWLSETPAQPSIGRRPARIVTWARFYHHPSGTETYVFNTHLTIRRGERQVASVRQILARIEALPAATTAILIGDFNSTAESSRTWQEATAGRLADAWRVAQHRFGPAVTWSGFAAPRDVDNRIDWILVGGPVQVHSIETVVHSDGISYPSDHFPVYAELRVTIPALIAPADRAAVAAPTRLR